MAINLQRESCFKNLGTREVLVERKIFNTLSFLGVVIFCVLY